MVVEVGNQRVPQVVLVGETHGNPPGEDEGEIEMWKE